jgi:hypothetical protein
MKLADIPVGPPKILMYGPAGSGKTAFAMTLGDGLRLYDLDYGVEVGRTLKDKFLDARMAVDIVRYDEQQLLSPTGWLRFRTDIFGLQNNKNIPKAICIDSLTSGITMAMRFVLSNNGRLDYGKGVLPPTIEQSHWGMAFTELTNVLLVLRGLPIPVVVLAHDQRDTQTSALELALPGKNLPSTVPQFFDELWYARVFPSATGSQYMIWTANEGFPAKTRRQVPSKTLMSNGLPSVLNSIGYQWPRP